MDATTDKSLDTVDGAKSSIEPSNNMAFIIAAAERSAALAAAIFFGDVYPPDSTVVASPGYPTSSQTDMQRDAMLTMDNLFTPTKHVVISIGTDTTMQTLQKAYKAHGSHPTSDAPSE